MVLNTEVKMIIYHGAPIFPVVIQSKIPQTNTETNKKTAVNLSDLG